MAQRAMRGQRLHHHTPVLRNEAGITTIGIYDFLLNYKIPIKDVICDKNGLIITILLFFLKVSKGGIYQKKTLLIFSCLVDITPNRGIL